MPNAVIQGWGKCIPPTAITNNDLATFLDTSDEWIKTRTGIHKRHISHVNTSELATVAAQRALACAGVSAQDIDFIIVATASPDSLVPNIASQIQTNLNAHCAAIDINAACSGFLYGLGMANALIQSDQHSNILIIGAERLSFYLNWSRRETAVLFGDGAGAVVLSASNKNYGISSYALQNYSHNKHLLYSDFGTKVDRFDPSVMDFYIHLEGPEVFKKAVSGMWELSQKVLDKAQLNQEQIDWLIPHQANERIIYALANKMNFPHHKTIVNIKDYGNTSAATIPIALCDALENDKIKPYQQILFTAFGAGLSCAAMTLQWGEKISPISDSDASLPPCDIDILQKIKKNYEYFFRRRNV